MDITKAAYKEFEAIAGEQSFKFVGKTIADISEANYDSDSLFSGFWDPSIHFDSEGLKLCSDRVKSLKTKILDALDAPDGAKARKFLGQAIHTIQDFYAHSNWLELTQSFPSDRSGIYKDLGTDDVQKKQSDNFCPNDPAVLDITINKITTGYFNLPEVCDDVPTGKCRHGSDIGVKCPGINKDTSKVGSTVANLAQEHTRVYLEEIVTDSRINGDVEKYEALFGSQGSLSVVIDLLEVWVVRLQA